MTGPSGVDESVIDRLLDGDPAIRWQTMRDLLDAAADDVAAERARVEHEGWGARLLALEDPDGLWDGGACFPASYRGGEPGQPWTATMHTLQTLQLLGLDPDSDAARRAIALVSVNGRWEHDGQRYFDGEVEPCINGRVVETGSYFGVDVAPVVEQLLGERLGDGGWNCEAENGSIRSSFDTTLNVLEGFVEFEHATGGSAEVRAARHSGERYLLERHLFRRKSTGEVVDSRYLDVVFPFYWRYDILRALDYFRCAGASPDPRMDEAVAGWSWARATGPTPSPSSARSDSPMAGGRSTPSIPVASTSTSSPTSAPRADGTHCVRSESSPGGSASVASPSGVRVPGGVVHELLRDRARGVVTGPPRTTPDDAEALTSAIG